MSEGKVAWIIIKRKRLLLQKSATGITIPKSEIVHIDDTDRSEQAKVLFKAFFLGQTEPKDAEYVTSIDSRSSRTSVHYFSTRRWTGSLLSRGISLIWFPLAGWKRLPSEDDRRALKALLENVDLEREK